MSVVTEILQQSQGLVGMALITLGAWALSEDRRARPGLRWILGALLLQALIALVVVRVPFVWSVIGLALITDRQRLNEHVVRGLKRFVIHRPIEHPRL